PIPFSPPIARSPHHRSFSTSKRSPACQSSIPFFQFLIENLRLTILLSGFLGHRGIVSNKAPPTVPPVNLSILILLWTSDIIPSSSFIGVSSTVTLLLVFSLGFLLTSPKSCLIRLSSFPPSVFIILLALCLTAPLTDVPGST